ncbi:MAG: hybrid sensor histidine kinase/response regulator, partial [Litoreibacter sp.]|nr:hybrid sensor histidine kinase/response regulator [Litoreibacter sp.]
TGYDRVMVYRFDADFNGEVIAEARQRTLEPYLGLRFPHWDIPSQARDIMAKIPLRFISDVDAEPVPLMAAEPKLDPLDMTFVECRGVSKVHMHNLRTMGTQTT